MALGLAAGSGLKAQTLTTLYSFCTGGTSCPDGQNVYAGLTQGLNGKLYGTTYQGGAFGGGTIFAISTTGSLSTVYSFCAVSGCTDGELLWAGLTPKPNGGFYGVTQAGGSKGYGTIFSITAAGVLTTAHNFCSLNSCKDGGYPYAGLFAGSNGSYYGTTFIGGGSNSQGTVFQMAPGGALTTLHNFCSGLECPDGSSAINGVIMANDGSLYGTTNAGVGQGWAEGLGNAGLIFKVTPANTFISLYTFGSQAAFSNGYAPRTGLVQGSDGNLYGTTYQSGATGGDYGTVFKVTLSGTLTTLYSFCAAAGCPDGANPAGTLIQATDGNYYGTTQFGGANNGGTIYKITAAGTLTTLYNFCGLPGCTDGQAPFGALFQATDGNLYGTTYQGGAMGKGTVFKFSTGLAPFVEMLPLSAAAGSKVQVLGTDLTGTTTVSFNGTAAGFTVVSPTQITATVPAGATSGTVQVKTPGGILSSNTAFQVLP